MATYKVKKLKIEKFRRMLDQEITIGDCITLIAGQNGTSKSTLLGLIAQPFNFKDDRDSKYVHHYQGIDVENCLTITGQKFESDYREIFRLSELSDKPGDHIYRIYIEGEDLLDKRLLSEKGLPVKSQLRTETKIGIRLVAGVRHTKGEGNFPHPIIYMGLGRLLPLAQCSQLQIHHEAITLDDDEKLWLHSMNRSILSLDDTPQDIEVIEPSMQGRPAYPAASYKEYKPDTYSSGQDNLGQILIALLSFKRLKKKLGSLYAGGIIFVDELDAVLFPSAQRALLKVLVDEAKESSLQIIATTHSVSMLEAAMKSSIKRDVHVVYLARENANVVVKDGLDYEQMRANLQLTRTEYSHPILFFEDRAAISFFRSITNNVLDEYFKYDAIGSSGLMKEVAQCKVIKSRLPAIYVRDADCQDDVGDAYMINLPSVHNLAPELELYAFLRNLDDRSEFWHIDEGFIKQAIFKDSYFDDPQRHSSDIKKWFRRMTNTNSDFFGNEGEVAFQFWRDENIELCRLFMNELSIMVHKVFALYPEIDDLDMALQAIIADLIPSPPPLNLDGPLFEWGREFAHDDETS